MTRSRSAGVVASVAVMLVFFTAVAPRVQAQANDDDDVAILEVSVDLGGITGPKVPLEIYALDFDPEAPIEDVAVELTHGDRVQVEARPGDAFMLLLGDDGTGIIDDVGRSVFIEDFTCVGLDASIETLYGADFVLEAGITSCVIVGTVVGSSVIDLYFQSPNGQPAGVGVEVIDWANGDRYPWNGEQREQLAAGGPLGVVNFDDVSANLRIRSEPGRGVISVNCEGFEDSIIEIGSSETELYLTPYVEPRAMSCVIVLPAPVLPQTGVPSVSLAVVALMLLSAGGTCSYYARVFRRASVQWAGAVRP